MNIGNAICLGYAAIFGLAGLVAMRLFRDPKPPYLKARWDKQRGDWVNEEAHDVGPDSLLLLEDLTAHLKAYGEAVADYYDTTTGD